MKVNVKNGTISRAEEKEYVARAHDLYPGVEVESIDITLDGDYADITYNFAAVRFQRIRRITGYLVGDLSCFNNAKRCEEKDRVKHDT